MKRFYSENYIPTNLLITALFFTLAFFGVQHHELWLDEAHHWLLARDSDSLSDLYHTTRYEGHPLLWNALLYAITRLTTDPFWMQLLHIAITTAAIWIFLKKAPFSLGVKLLFVFGYFTLFEYSIISRNYGIGMLFVFLACSLYSKKEQRFVLLSTYLALACQTHAVFMVLAGSFMLLILLQRLQRHHWKVSKQTLLGVSIFGSSVLFALLQILPPEDTTFFGNATLPLSEKLPKALTPFFKGVFVLPEVGSPHFWNTHAVFSIHKMLGGILALASLLVPYIFFHKNKWLLFYVYFGIAGAGVFFYITQLSAARYCGMLYLLFISALWISTISPQEEANYTSSSYYIFLKKTATLLLFLILGLQSFSGIYAYAADLTRPFTNAKQVIHFLKEKGLSDTIIATRACDGTPISAYKEAKVFFTKFGSFESYCKWNQQDILHIQEAEAIVTSLKKLLVEENKSVIFISYQPVFGIKNQGSWMASFSGIRFRFLEKFENSIVTKGTYYIYEFSEK